jgi:hypothetical protein
MSLGQLSDASYRKLITNRQTLKPVLKYKEVIVFLGYYNVPPAQPFKDEN